MSYSYPMMLRAVLARPYIEAPLLRAIAPAVAPEGGGFGAALRLDAANTDAQIGQAEVLLELGRVRAAFGDAER
jgi:hypothetical protein